jgi:Tol biopolymer transport system component
MGRFASTFALVLLLGACLPAESQVLRRLTRLNPDRVHGWSLDDAGDTVVAIWSGDPHGTNPRHADQLFKWELPSATPVQLTSFPAGVGFNVSISDDGQQVLFDSQADPLLQNGDGTPELFLMQTDGSGIVQLTDDDVLGPGRAPCATLSGSGNRVLFYGTYDPNGTNPDHEPQLFVLDLGSSNLTQLTQGDSGLFVPAGPCPATISDDGERIVFSSSADLTGGNPNNWIQVFRIDADGQNLQQLTSDPGEQFAWGISGNGARIVFVERGGGSPGTGNIERMDWDGSNRFGLPTGRFPSIDDYGNIFFTANAEIHKAPILGSPQLIDDTVPYAGVTVSGSGNHLACNAVGMLPGQPNPDEGPELATMTSSGTEQLQLTINAPYERAFEPDIAADGSRVVYRNFNPGGSLLEGLFRVDLNEASPNPAPVLIGGRHEEPTLTGDALRVAFKSWDDLFSTGCNQRTIYSVAVDGTALIQLSNNPGCQPSVQPAAASDGGVVVFQSTSGQGSQAGDVFTVPLMGGGITSIYTDDDTFYKRPSISGDGRWASWHGPVGGSWRVFRARTDGSFLETMAEDDALYSDLSYDGRLVTYVSEDDPFGTNADGNQELFIHDAQTDVTTQLTETTDGDTWDPRISDDGSAIFFVSTSSFFGEQVEDAKLYRLTIADGTIERAGRLFGVVTDMSWNGHPGQSVDGDGGKVVFASYRNALGDLQYLTSDIWLADFETPSTLRPSKATPTVVSWEPDPRALHSDVIRGDVANLGPGAGSTVDLGEVSCLENDTVNSDTAGAEADPLHPAPGQVLFFVRRLSQGPADGGSYGAGSNGGERFPSSGDCSR